MNVIFGFNLLFMPASINFIKGSAYLSRIMYAIRVQNELLKNVLKNVTPFRRFNLMSSNNYAPDASGNQFLSKVYMWMFAGMLITAVVSYAIYMSPSLQAMFLPYYFILLIIELLVVIVLSWKIKSMSPALAAGAFILYALLNGITLTAIIMSYTISSVFVVFVVAAGMFIGMSLFGFFTKRDLSTIGRFAIMALIGIIIAMILNMLLYMIVPSTAVWIDLGISIIAVIIFAALTAYDTQKIKEIGRSIEYGAPYSQNLAVICALTLYLDFINLFIQLLSIFGNRR